MKSSKRDLSYAQRKQQGRKSGDKSTALKLDRKSSRGMIYENEELRLRTININAEVERGQSDIRKLRRENEQLRREIWSLRDEYDRLNKKFKANKILPDNNGETHYLRSGSISEDSDSCDACREDENDLDDYDDRDYCDGKQLRHNNRDDSDDSDHGLQECADNYENSQKRLDSKLFNKTHEPLTDGCGGTASAAAGASSGTKQRDNLHVNFDHLSVVSEENLTNSDGNSTQHVDVVDAGGGRDCGVVGAASLPISLHMYQTALGSPMTPVTPIEMVANQLNDLQSIVPPLSYFENIVSDHLNSDDVNYSTTSTTTTGETVVPSNGWDFNIQSPFASRKFPPSVSTPTSSPHTADSSSTTTTPVKAVSVANMTTTVPESAADTSVFSTNSNIGNSNNSIVQRSPKHFFSPIKPRLRVDTNLAAPTPATDQSSPSSSIELTTPAGPDIFVANVLGSSYHPQLSCTTVATTMCTLTSPSQPSEPVYATVQKATIHQRSASPKSVQTRSGNLEDLLHDIETLSQDILQMQLKKNNSHSMENVTSASPTATASSTCENLSNSNCNSSKPYRSEMNLLLSYNGMTPVITTLEKSSSETLAPPLPPLTIPPIETYAMNVASSGSCAAGSMATNSRFQSVLGQDITDTPPPNVPEPMMPLPHNLTYLGFENYCKSISPPNIITTYPMTEYADTAAAPLMCCAPYVPVVPRQIQASSNPDLSHTRSPAALRRKFFSRRTDDTQATRSFEVDDAIRLGTPMPAAMLEMAGGKVQQQPPIFEISKHAHEESSASENANCESSSGSEAAKRKSRRVSILFCDRRDDESDRNNKEKESAGGDGGEDALQLPHQQAHSTPNSPHSGRRRNSNATTASGGGHHHHGHHHHHHHHHHGGRKMSQESRGSNSLNHSLIGLPGQLRSKSSRRHSDGTVTLLHAGGGGSSVRNSDYQGIVRDSYNDAGTSLSERNSNSLASSRESSTSLSMRSQRRKISVSSHTGGKIPWCGCWGNGCL